MLLGVPLIGIAFACFLIILIDASDEYSQPSLSNGWKTGLLVVGVICIVMAFYVPSDKPTKTLIITYKSEVFENIKYSEPVEITIIHEVIKYNFDRYTFYISLKDGKKIKLKEQDFNLAMQVPDSGWTKLIWDKETWEKENLL